MGPVEEGSKVATSVVDALKASPGLLTVLIFNIVFIGLLAYATMTERKHWAATVELIAKACAPGRVELPGVLGSQ
jgi:hypothetical protein